VSSLLQTEFKVGANARFEQQATEIASSTLDNQMATGSATLLTETGDSSLPSVTSSGQTYLLEREVAPFDPGNTQCVSPTSDPGAMLKVSIWATWTDQAAGATWWLAGSSGATGQVVEETSLVAVPAAVVNPSLGSILVTIQGASGQAVSDLTVTATPSTGSPQTVTTTAGGCALFANIAATVSGTPTWTISFGTLSGYITEQELSTLPTQASLSVTAGATTSLYFEATVSPYDAYDRAATVNPVYAVPVAYGYHPIAPTNIGTLPLSLYSANLQVNPYVSASPAQVFPMPNVPSYYVVAGSCGAESAPRGSTLDGQPVTVSAGGTASPTMNLVPVQIFVNHAGTLVSGYAVTASVSNAAGTGADPNCPTSGVGVVTPLQLGSTKAAWTSFTHNRKRHHAGAILVSTCSSNCATATALTSNLNPSTAGANVTFTATVTCSPTACAASPNPGPPTAGTVQFKDNGVALGSPVNINGSGVATYSTTTLAVGTHPITAVYSGSGTKWALSTSSTVSQVVNGAPTTTALAAVPNPNAYGTSATLTATVTCSASGCGTPTGTVTFTNGGVNITGCVGVTVTAGVATCTLSGLNGGSYSVAAVYTPTTNYKTSTSSTVTQQVVAASTTTVLTSSSSPNSPSGSSLTFTATVTAASGGPAVGNVAFKDGATTLATVAVNGSGVATYTTSTLAVGTHSVSAVFTATNPSNFGPSTGTLIQGIDAAFTLSGLPYGVWLLSATNGTFSSTGEPPIVLTVTASGISINGGAVQAAGSAGAVVTMLVQ